LPKRRTRQLTREVVPITGVPYVDPGEEFIWKDPRLKIPLPTYPTIKDFKGRSFIEMMLAMNMIYDPDAKEWKFMETAEEMTARLFGYYYPTEPAALTAAGYYRARIDEYYRLMVNIAANNAGLATETTLSSIDTKVATETTLASELSRIAKLQGYDGTAWQNLLVQSAAYPNQRMAIYDGATIANVKALNLDGIDPASTGMYIAAMLHGFNGTTWDRLKSQIHIKSLLTTDTYHQNLLRNPGFETGDTTGWYGIGTGTWVVQSTTVREGSYAAQITPDAGATYRIVQSQNIPVKPVQVVKVRAELKADANITLSRIDALWYSSEANYIASSAGVNYGGNYDWTAITQEFIVPDRASYMRPQIITTSGATPGNLYVDNCHQSVLEAYEHDTKYWGGTKLTGRDISQDLAKLDVALSTLRRKDYQTVCRQRAGSLGALTEDVVYDVSGKPVCIESFSWACNNPTFIEIRITPYNADGTLGTTMRVVEKSGTTLEEIGAEEINSYYSDLFEQVIYDTTNNWFKHILRRRLHFGNGVKISAYNSDGAVAHNVAVQVLIKEETA